MDDYKNASEPATAKQSSRQKAKRRRYSAALAASSDVETNDIPSKISKFESPSKLKLKFVVQSAKGDNQVSTIVRNLNDEISPKKMDLSPQKSPSPNKLSSPVSEFTSPNKLRMKISMVNQSVSFNHDDSQSETQNVLNESTFDLNDMSKNAENENVGKKKTSRVPEFIADRSSRVKSYFRRRHAPFKRTFDLVCS